MGNQSKSENHSYRRETGASNVPYCLLVVILTVIVIPAVTFLASSTQSDIEELTYCINSQCIIFDTHASSSSPMSPHHVRPPTGTANTLGGETEGTIQGQPSSSPNTEFGTEEDSENDDLELNHPELDHNWFP